ncbi:MAG: stalk domain-containing protein [Bacillota bacterium]
MSKKAIVSVLVTSALLAGGSYAQASPAAVATVTVAPAPISAVPISAPVEVPAGITAKEINEKTDLITIRMRIPQLAGMRDQQFETGFNRQREVDAHQAIAAAKNNLEEMAANAKANGWPVRPGELLMDFDARSTGTILSLVVTQYSYMGGANGLTTVTTYNVDTKENRVIATLPELFKDGADYQSVLNTKIAEEIRARLKEMPTSYFEGKMGFQSITPAQGFYLEDGDLVIVFPKYGIAPGATGIPKFRIPMADLKDLLKESLIPAAEVVSLRHVVVTPEVNEAGVKMIPLRVVCEKLGYQVNWNEDQQMVEIAHGAQWTRVFIGQDNYSYAKMLIRLGTAPMLKDSKTYVPASFAEQVLKATVTDHDGTLTISQ